MERFIITILLIAFLQCIVSSSQANTNVEPGWTICQVGPYGTLADFTSHAVRMHINHLGLTIITKSPKWDAIIFNDKTKTYVKLPYNNWQKTIGIISNYRSTRDGLSLIARSTGKRLIIEKHPCIEYCVSIKEDPKIHITEKKVAQIWVANDIKLPTPVAQLYCSTFGIPTQKGIPLQISSYSDNGQLVSKLETISIKQCEICPSTFNPLPGYKNAKDEMELIVGKQSKEIVADMLDVPTNEKVSSQK